MNKTFEFKVKENTYTVEYPTPRQQIKIEGEKARLTNGDYNNILRSGTALAITALDDVDLQANLSVLVPELIKDMAAKGVESPLDMNPMDYRQLKDAYVKNFIPWISEFYHTINAAPTPLPEIKKEEVKDGE